MNLCEVKAHSGVLLAKVGLLYVWLTAKSSWRRQRHWFDPELEHTSNTQSLTRQYDKIILGHTSYRQTHTKEPDGLKSTDTVTAHSREAWSWTPWRERSVTDTICKYTIYHNADVSGSKVQGGGQGLFEVCRKKKNNVEYAWGVQVRTASTSYSLWYFIFTYMHIYKVKLYNLCNIVRAVSESPSWLFSFR